MRVRELLQFIAFLSIFADVTLLGLITVQFVSQIYTISKVLRGGGVQGKGLTDFHWEDRMEHHNGGHLLAVLMK